MSSVFESLVAAAVRAPSGDNSQPWRFEIDFVTRRIDLILDETRDPSPMNAGQRMARIALGAAFENLLLISQANGLEPELLTAQKPSLISLRLRGDGASAIRIPNEIMDRVTNRRFYEHKPLEDVVLKALHEGAPPLENVRTIWITDRLVIEDLARIIAKADLEMFGEPSMRRAFLKNVRFDAPDGEEVDRGLSLASLELSRFERLALPTMGRLPDWLLRYGGGLRAFGTKARKLVESASGLCLILASGSDQTTDIAVGRAMQRAWLSLTKHGFAAQPMMSLPVLENAASNASLPGSNTLNVERVVTLSRAACEVVGQGNESRIAFILRFGFAAPPSGRTGRLPIEQAIVAKPPTMAERAPANETAGFHS
jgi:hypothetical protein